MMVGLLLAHVRVDRIGKFPKTLESMFSCADFSCIGGDGMKYGDKECVEMMRTGAPVAGKLPVSGVLQQQMQICRMLAGQRSRIPCCCLENIN